MVARPKVMTSLYGHCQWQWERDLIDVRLHLSQELLVLDVKLDPVAPETGYHTAYLETQYHPRAKGFH